MLALSAINSSAVRTELEIEVYLAHLSLTPLKLKTKKELKKLLRFMFAVKVYNYYMP